MVRIAQKPAMKRPERIRANNRPALDISSPSFAKEFQRAAKAFTKRHTVSPEAALAILVEEGILTKSGKLSKNYR